MSFRHTYITEFLYKFGKEEEIEKIRDALQKYGTAEWKRGGEGLGYFHGVFKDLNGQEIKNSEREIIKDIEDKTGVKIKIVFEE